MPHIHEKIDFTSTVYVVFNNKVLLHQHKKLKFWLGVGGHIELDEDPNQTAIKEAKEESGLDITLIDHMPNRPHLADYGKHRTLIPPRYMDIHNVTETHEHIDNVYFATSTNDAVIPEDPTMILKWFSEEELTDPQYKLPEKIIFYCKEALKAA
jgi:8-oxo-dGTP diphosphatase